MSNLETITRENLSRFDETAPDLAGIYTDAFSRAPWFETYDEEELIAGWRTKLARGAIMEVTRDDTDRVRRMTLVLSMTLAELCSIKYPDKPAMCEWLQTNVAPLLGESPVVAWVDDTAGNRRDDPNAKGLYPSVERLRTLQTASSAYGYYEDRCGAWIPATVLTRTKQDAIVATTRNAVPGTQIYVGNDGYTAGFAPDGTVPDDRTLLIVPGWAIPEKA